MTALEFYRKHLHALVSTGKTEYKTEPEIFQQAKEMDKEKEEQYNNMLSMLQETYRRLEHTDMISLRKQIKEVLTFKSE